MRSRLICSFIIAAVSIALGAFGSHGLREKLDARDFEIYQTSMHYQQFGSVLLLVLVIIERLTNLGETPMFWTLLGGILIFSGSLIILVMSGVRTWGSVTPVGGIMMIGSLLGVAFQLWRMKD